MSAASVRPWPCPACKAEAGQPCRTLKRNRITDTHVQRLTRPAHHHPAASTEESTS